MNPRMIVAAAAVGAAFTFAAPVGADDRTFIDQVHGSGVPIFTQNGPILWDGHMACAQIRNGVPIEDVKESYELINDFRTEKWADKVIAITQRELCPDTLRPPEKP